MYSRLLNSLIIIVVYCYLLAVVKKGRCCYGLASPFKNASYAPSVFSCLFASFSAWSKSFNYFLLFSSLLAQSQCLPSYLHRHAISGLFTLWTANNTLCIRGRLVIWIHTLLNITRDGTNLNCSGLFLPRTTRHALDRGKTKTKMTRPLRPSVVISRASMAL